MNLYLNQAAEFFARFGRFGGTITMVGKLLGNDELMQWWVEQLCNHPLLKLVHGMYKPVSDILSVVEARLAEQGIDRTQFTWKGPEACPFEFTSDPEVVVVLDITLGTLEETCDFAYEWAKKGQTGGGWRWEGMLSDDKHLRILEGASEFVPYRLRWRRVKLNANPGKSPESVRDPQKSIGLVGLFVAAQHPVRITKIDYEKILGFWLAGLVATAPGGAAGRLVPCVLFDQGDRQVAFHSYPRGDAYSSLAVPMFWED